MILKEDDSDNHLMLLMFFFLFCFLTSIPFVLMFVIRIPCSFWEGGDLCGIVATNVLDYEIVVNKFKLHSSNYIHFWTPWKSRKPLIFLDIG